MIQQQNSMPRQIEGPSGDQTIVAPQEQRGLTLEEIRYRRALVLLQREFAREALMNDLERLRSRTIFGREGKGNGPSFGTVAGVASKVFSKISYMDYFVLGMSVFGTIRKVVGFFRGRRKRN